MSMQAGSNYADIIDEKDIKRICPKEFKALKKGLKDKEVDFASFAQDAMFDMVEDAVLKTLLSDLQAAFLKKTKLTLFLERYDGDISENHDDLEDGGYWCIGNAFIPNPAIADAGLNGKVNRKSYVTFT